MIPPQDDAAPTVPRLREVAMNPRVVLVSASALSTSVALLNGVVVQSLFPALTVFESRTLSTNIALAAGWPSHSRSVTHCGD